MVGICIVKRVNWYRRIMSKEDKIRSTRIFQHMSHISLSMPQVRTINGVGSYSKENKKLLHKTFNQFRETFLHNFQKIQRKKSPNISHICMNFVKSNL